jgi:two-component system, chemotaxis family, CheB/CheR fusion protein
MPHVSPGYMHSESDPPQEEKEPIIAPFPIVGVGASAGGLQAFSQLLGALPLDTGMAFVLVQHLEPSHKSHLTEILSRATAMPVNEVGERMRIEPNHIYVIPPNAELGFAEQAFHLVPRSVHAGPHLTIDAFFQALAANQGRLAIGVVLSGTGSDGSQGIQAIKNACGITFAQDEGSAQYPSMPRNAVATGVVDYVLPPAQIAAEIARIGHHRYLVLPSGKDHDEVLPDGEAELTQILSLLLRTTGVDFRHYKQTTFRRRVGRRMIVHHSENLRDYLAYVGQHPDEVDELYRDLLINVTSFFRDPEAFVALGDKISTLVKNKNEHIRSSFRVWAPACSTGEELYSLAMCALDVFEQEGLRPTLQFFGTDISERALQTARGGVYAEHNLQNVSAQRLSRYFRKVDGKYQISKSVRESCIFARHDVTRDAPFSHLDLISCRNMLIYLEPVLQKGLMPIFHYGLNPSGLLFLGSAEGIGSATDLFSTVDSMHRIFSRKPGPSRFIQALPNSHNPAEPWAQAQVESSIGGLELAKRVDRIIQTRYAPDGVVVDQNLEIRQFRGHTGFYLEPPEGTATHHLLRMARTGLEYALRETTSRALEQNQFIEKKGIRIEHAGTVRMIDLEVVPVAGATGTERFCLVVFKQVAPEATPLSSAQAIANPEDHHVARLQLELAEAREYLRAVSEDAEAALEEARAANEELQSANEELQSSNEELGTAKEELQSTNEELTTVNEELGTRNQQLGILGDDLTNLLGAVNAPILRVDRDLCLCRFTPAAEKAFGVGPADLQHPIRLLQSRLGTPVDFEGLIREVISSLTIQSHKVQDAQGHWWSLSIRPYRTADDRLDGAVLTFVDVDSIQHALQASQEAQQYADAIVETVREPLVILRQDLRVERANASFYGKFHLHPEQTEGQHIYELDAHRWKIPKLRLLMQEISVKKNSFTDLEIKHAFPHIGTRVMLLNARQLQLESHRRILLAFEDITDRRRAEESITERLEETDRELDRTKDELRALAGHLMTVQEEEQRRIARELHDDLVQRLGFLEFQIEQYRLGPIGNAGAEVTEMLTTLQTQVAELSDATRNISHGLHPAILDDLGLVAALRKLAKDLSRGRPTAVRFTSRVGRCSLPRRHFAAAIYRIAQEALHNAIKHTSGAGVTISLGCKRNELLLTIRDTGPGFDRSSVRGAGGLGIVNMEERARLLGATLRIDSRAGKSTTITLRAPLPQSPCDETSASDVDKTEHN